MKGKEKAHEMLPTTRGFGMVNRGLPNQLHTHVLGKTGTDCISSARVGEPKLLNPCVKEDRCTTCALNLCMFAATPAAASVVGRR